MSPGQKAEFKQAIEAKIVESKKAIEDLKEATKPMGLDSSIGRISRMDYINNKPINEAELLKAGVRVQALERWLSLSDTDQLANAPDAAKKSISIVSCYCPKFPDVLKCGALIFCCFRKKQQTIASSAMSGFHN